jgi:hypothetical protein
MTVEALTPETALRLKIAERMEDAARALRAGEVEDVALAFTQGGDVRMCITTTEEPLRMLGAIRIIEEHIVRGTMDIIPAGPEV